MAQRFFIETLGCPKNQVDSDKLAGKMAADGMTAADDMAQADVVVVNTCAFIEEARQESIDTVLAIADENPEAELVITGCMAERYGAELAEALPEADQVAGFGVPVAIGAKPVSGGAKPVSGGAKPVSGGAKPAPPSFDLLNLPRPASERPWAYVKIAEGCDRACGFCAIPTFRGPQRSRTIASIIDEVDQLQAKEVVLVAQDLASYGRDQGQGTKDLVKLVEQVAKHTEWVRLLYLYPSELNDALIDAICATEVPYFDLSLQHVSAPLMRRMRRWGDGRRFLERIDAIRTREQTAAFRSNFIVGYPGETEHDHDQLIEFVEAAELDWCGFFAYSPEDGTYAADLDAPVDTHLMHERLAELRELQDAITAKKRDEMIGQTVRVLVDEPGIARSTREAPEIDGIVAVPVDLPVGEFSTVTIGGALGPDLMAEGVSGEEITDPAATAEGAHA